MDLTTQGSSAPTKDEVRVTGRRAIAAVVDMVVVAAFFFLVAKLAGTADTAGPNVSIRLDGGPAIIWAVGVFLYYFLSEAVAAQTLGKMLLGLHVVRAEDGRHPSVGAIAARNVLRVVDGLPFLYGLGMLVVLVVLVTPERQRIGDLAGRTVVTRFDPGRTGSGRAARPRCSPSMGHGRLAAHASSASSSPRSWRVRRNPRERLAPSRS